MKNRASVSGLSAGGTGNTVSRKTFRCNSTEYVLEDDSSFGRCTGDVAFLFERSGGILMFSVRSYVVRAGDAARNIRAFSGDVYCVLVSLSEVLSIIEDRS